MISFSEWVEEDIVSMFLVLMKSHHLGIKRIREYGYFARAYPNTHANAITV
jgi:hypothetical protein